MTATDLDTKLERAAKPPEQRTVFDLIGSLEAELVRSLGSEQAAVTLARHYTTAIRYNPLLRQCTPESVAGALLLSAQVRLEPGPLGHVYLVPFRHKDRGFEVNWILGYTGIIELGRRGGATGLRATVIWSSDDWTGIKNVNGDLRYTHVAHAPNDRSERLGVLIEWKDGPTKAAVWCPPSRIDTALAHRKAKDDSVRNEDWYWRKTGVRFARPFLPLSTDLAYAVASDDAVVRGIEVEDGTAEPVYDAIEVTDA